MIEMIESDKYTTLVLSKLRDSVFVVSHFREHLHGFILIREPNKCPQTFSLLLLKFPTELKVDLCL